MKLRNYTIIGLLALLGLSSDAPGKKSEEYTLPYTSIEDGERALCKLIGHPEVAWITDGKLWENIIDPAYNPTRKRTRISEERFRQFLQASPVEPLFFYHQHSKHNVYVLNPPTPADLDGCNNLNAVAQRDIVCRVVEPRVIWEHGRNTFRGSGTKSLSLRDLPYSPFFFIELDAILDKEFSEGQIDAVLCLYAEYGVDLKVKK